MSMLTCEPMLGAPELAAVGRALADELDASRLRGFAASLAPEYACVASLLRARASLLDRFANRREARAERMRRLGAVRSALAHGPWDPGAAVQFVDRPHDPAAGLARLILDASGSSYVARSIAQRFSCVEPWPSYARVAGAIAAGAHPEELVAGAALVAPQRSARAGGPAWSYRLQTLGFPDLYASLAGDGPNARAAELLEFVESSRAPGGSSPRARAVALAKFRATRPASTLVDRASRGAASAIKTIACAMIARGEAEGDGPLAAVARSLVVDLGADIRAIDPLRYRAVFTGNVRPSPEPLRTHDRARWCAYYA